MKSFEQWLENNSFVTMIPVPRNLVGKNFVIYEIDRPNANYSGVDDMIPLGKNLVATICDNPITWANENLGQNEVPIAFIMNNKIKYSFFGKGKYKFSVA